MLLRGQIYSGLLAPMSTFLPSVEERHAVAYLVEVLRVRYNLKGRAFDSGLGHWIIQLTQFFKPYYGTISL
jgi:hypothetical protein